MFTGIVRAVGTVTTVGDGMLTVDLAGVSVATGDSVAVSGACLTVAGVTGGVAEFAVSPETRSRCLINEWSAGTRVNLEPALTLQTPLGGHLVAGHIDGVAAVTAVTTDDANGDFTVMQFETSRELGKLIADKGAVAIDGVALTSNAVTDGDDDNDNGNKTNFSVALVPHTLINTTLGELKTGARAHIEADLVARYVQRLTK